MKVNVLAKMDVDNLKLLILFSSPSMSILYSPYTISVLTVNDNQIHKAMDEVG